MVLKKNQFVWKNKHLTTHLSFAWSKKIIKTILIQLENQEFDVRNKICKIQIKHNKLQNTKLRFNWLTKNISIDKIRINSFIKIFQKI